MASPYRTGPLGASCDAHLGSARREEYLIGAHGDPWYTSLMRREDWARLARPFPAPALTWHVVEVETAEQRVRVEPRLDPAAIVDRLDDAVGREGWSNRYLPLGPAAVICELTIASVTKSAVAGGVRGMPFEAGRAADAALSAAAERFGLRPPAEASVAYWVDADPETGQPLHEPEVRDPGAPAARREEPGASASAPEEPGDDSMASVEPSVASVEPNTAAVTLDEPDAFGGAQGGSTAVANPQPSPHQDGREVIDRLMDRLRAEGLGADAARLVMTFGGYGRDPDDARELYRRLRALLLERAAPAS